MSPLVYIACPYTKGDVAVNVRNGARLFEYLANAGVMPFNPLLSHFQHMMYHRDYEWWLEWDLQFIRKCDAVVRLAGESEGADREVALAKKLGLPLFILTGMEVTALSDLDSFILSLKRDSK